jgi:hypothetical protein
MRVAGWFEERVRPLAPGLPEGEEGDWVALDALSAEQTLADAEAALWRTSRLPARAALTLVAGWTAGTVAEAIAVGALRDGVVVRLSAGTGVEALRHADGWIADLRLQDAPAAVGPGHPWAGTENVEVVDDVAAAAVAEIVAACEPMIAALTARSGRGAAGLWAQVADCIALCAHPLEGPDKIAAVQRLIAVPGAPWRIRPDLWLAESGVLVHHRRSCCLWYRGDPAAAEQPHPDQRDPVYDAAFPRDGPTYCENCLFRSPADVEARAIFWAGR